MTNAVKATAGLHFSSFKDDKKPASEDVEDAMSMAGEDSPLPDFAAIREEQLKQRELEAELNG